MHGLSNYPRANPAREAQIREFRVTLLWFGWLLIMNTAFTLSVAFWYFFSNCILGELELSLASYIQVGIASAMANFFLCFLPWSRFVELTRRARGTSGIYVIVTLMASVPCFGAIPLFWGWRELRRHQQLVEDIRVTVAPKETAL
ncbi:MAG TPA: hypothetical protein VK171_00305 [Fimbriimonas sp.]|nr:hypothetical protein [Fimbriimonas sp.]